MPSDAEVARLASELRAAVGVTGLASTLVAPVSHSRLLELIVQTAAHVLNARGGSLLLLDEQTQELVFTVSATEDVSQLRDIRVPLGHGIAGLVALSGQPMAVADAQSDPRHASDIAERTGYLPQSLLCVPLTYNDSVTGVLELLDKRGKTFFDADDIHALSLFANQAAIAIELSRAQRDLATLLRELIASLGASAELAQRTSVLADDVQLEPAFKRAVELATLIHSVAQSGTDASDLSMTVMRGISSYVRH